MNYNLLKKKLIAKIYRNPNIKELNVYLAMALIDSSKYDVAKAVLEILTVEGFLEKQGKVWIIKVRNPNEVVENIGGEKHSKKKEKN